MKKTHFLFFALMLIFSCQKEMIETTLTPHLDAHVADRAPTTIPICHQTGNGDYVAMNVPLSALGSHLAHGDFLADADADGYTAISACSGSMNDCNDNSASVHPGA